MSLLPELFVPLCSLSYCNYSLVVQIGYSLLSLCFRLWSDYSFSYYGICLAKSSDTDVPSAFQSQGLSTYKELCSLASDLNQPDLVYKFMNLANHHAMWNSRKVIRCFHTTSILTVCSGNSNCISLALFAWSVDNCMQRPFVDALVSGPMQIY